MRLNPVKYKTAIEITIVGGHFAKDNITPRKMLSEAVNNWLRALLCEYIVEALLLDGALADVLTASHTSL